MLFSARAALLGVVCAFGWNIAATARHLCFLGAVYMSVCPPVQGICILYIYEPVTHLQCLGCLVWRDADAGEALSALCSACVGEACAS